MDDMVTRGVGLGGARQAGAGSARQILAASRWISCASRARHGPITSPRSAGSNRRRGAICLIAAEAARLTAHPDGPVIAAGSTGSMPATAKFLHAVARPAARRGGAARASIPISTTNRGRRSAVSADAQGKFTTPPASNHPQFAMHALLGSLRPPAATMSKFWATPAPHGRDVLVSETMRPSTATAQWHDRLEQPGIAAKISGGMTNLAVIEALQPGDGGAGDRGGDARGAASRTNPRHW